LASKPRQPWRYGYNGGSMISGNSSSHWSRRPAHACFAAERWFFRWPRPSSSSSSSSGVGGPTEAAPSASRARTGLSYRTGLLHLHTTLRAAQRGIQNSDLYAGERIVGDHPARPNPLDGGKQRVLHPLGRARPQEHAPDVAGRRQQLGAVGRGDDLELLADRDAEVTMLQGAPHLVLEDRRVHHDEHAARCQTVADLPEQPGGERRLDDRA